MTFAEMTTRSWALLGGIAGILGVAWCGAWLWWSVRKVDKPGDGPDEQYEKFD